MVKVGRLARKKLGEILVEEGLVREDQVGKALLRQKETAELLGESLVALGFVNEEDIAQAISHQFGIPFLDVAQYQIAGDFGEVSSFEEMSQHQFVILDKIGKALLVAVSGSIDPRFFEELERRTGSDLHLVVSTVSSVRNQLRRQAPPEDQK